MPILISRVLHAGYIFEDFSTRIIFDPIFKNPFSRNCYAFPEVTFDEDQIHQQNFSAIFISHFHEDHCCLESLNLLNKSIPIYIYCLHQELVDMISEIGFTNIHTLELNQPITLGSFTLTTRKALDPDVDCIFHIQHNFANEQLNILNVVDAWIDLDTLDKLKKTAYWDLILWPFQTLREIEVLSPNHFSPSDSRLPEEWIEQIKSLNPKNIVPSSCQFVHEKWSWYNLSLFPISYRNFKDQVQYELPQTQIININPGSRYHLDPSGITQTTALPWIKIVSGQDEDYSYNKDLCPPSTSEIAKNFPALSSSAYKKVQNYCENDLIQKFKLLSETDEIYFNKIIHWQLAIYDHQGLCATYSYIIDRQNIILNESPYLKVDWLTEVPSYTLHAALQSGESLTSMYLRINDTSFSPDLTFPKGSDVDLLQDPLIRCLFTNEFGGFHKEQLKRIKNEI